MPVTSPLVVAAPTLGEWLALRLIAAGYEGAGRDTGGERLGETAGDEGRGSA